MRFRLLLSVASGLLTFSAIVQAGTPYSFDEHGQLNDFLPNHVREKGQSAWRWDATAGRHGSGGLIADNQTTTSVLTLNKPFAGSLPSQTLSIAFRWTTPSIGLGHGIFVGVGPRPDYVPFTSPAAVEQHHHQFYFGIGRVEGNTVRLVGNSTNGEEKVHNFQSGTSSHVELTPDAWYHLEGKVTYNDDEKTYEIAVTLSSMDENGELRHLSTATFKTASIPELAADPEVYAFFGSGHTAVGRGTAALDEFTIGATNTAP